MRSLLRPATRALTGLVISLVVAGSPPAAAAPRVDVYPAAGTTSANPATQISFRGATALGRLVVTGSRSGRHRGRLAAHSDGNGVSFLPRRRFRYGELVTVRSGARLTGARGGAVRFRILIRPTAHDRAKLPTEVSYDPGGRPAEAQSFQSRPDLRPPDLNVTLNLPSASGDDIFLAPKAGPGQNGPMIRDAAGKLIWFRSVSPPLSPFNFREQTYRGRPVLTWWQGRVIEGRGHGYGVVLDSSYRPVMRVGAGNGFEMDHHEFQLTPRGTALITAYEPIRADLSPLGGVPNGFAWDAIVQEIDMRTGLVLFEWHSQDHVPLRLSAQPTHGPSVDAFHVNSIEEDGSDRLLLSSRNTNALFEIDRHTGGVVWRLGGFQSSFAMGPGTTAIGQHDARRQPDGTITMFDNGATGDPSDRESRGIQLAVDTATHKTTLVHEYKHPGLGPLIAASQGSMEVLPNGNVFIGWGGGQPYVTEFTADGQAVFEASMQPAGDDSYRAYRLPWRGAVPATKPDVSASGGTLSTDVYASWNGATEVDRWVVLAGADPRALVPASTALRTDFETQIVVAGVVPKYVAVRALDRGGKVLGTSAAVRVGS